VSVRKTSCVQLGILPSEAIAGIRHLAVGETPISAEVVGGVIDHVRDQLDADDQEHQRRQELLEQLTIASDGNGLDMVYQPIVDLETRKVVGVESLARFSLEPKRPPNEWFEVAADLGLATHLEVTAVSRAIARRSQLPPGVFKGLGADSLNHRPPIPVLWKYLRVSEDS
jgi:hypothetical protein